MTVEKDANGREHLSLPARMTALFASGLDYEATLQGVVDLLVPELAAWAAIDLFDGEGLRRVAATVDAIAGHEEVIADLKQHPQQASAPATLRALELQRARIVHIENETQFVWPVRSEAHLAMYRDALPISVILAPLQAGEEVLGYLQLASIRGRRRYSESDALLVEDVAQRASFAIRTAQLVTALRGELAKRQAASHALEASEARYRRMFEASPYPVWVFDVKTLAFLAVNPAAIAQYGYSLHEFLRLTIRDIRPANEQRRLDEALRRDVRGSRDAGIFRHQRRDGSTFLAEIRAHDIEFDGREARVVQALDVTDRIRAFDAMRVAEERHRLVSRVTKEAIWEWNPATGELVWNQAFYDHFHFDRLAISSTREWYDSRIHPDDREHADAELAESFAAREEQSTRRFRFKRGDGTVAHVEERAVIAWNGDVAERVVGSLADVTVQQQLGEQLAIAQRLEAVGRLAGGVSHDFNNLLTAIRGFASFALDEQLPNSRAREDIEQVLQAADRAAALTRQLLAFSRRQVLQPQLVNVNEILNNLHRMLTRVLGEDVEVRSHFDPALPMVTVDPGQLEQVIMNLVVNARDAMPEGGILTIETSHVHLDQNYAESHMDASTGDHVLIAITDTGIGMEAQTMKRIFEPFFSTKDRDKGTGLGLATSYGIIQQSGGHMWVYSEPGRGSTFKVYLPRAVDDEVVVTRPTPVSGFQLDGTETVLLVEDDDRVRRVSANALKRHGYRVLEARSAESALTTFIEHRDEIDMVVSDVVLPRKSGPTLLQELHILRADLRVLFVSGYTENAFLASGGIYKDFELLEKPFAPDVLVRHVRAILDRPAPG